MRKLLLLSVFLAFVACSSLDGTGGHRSAVPACATMSAPWVGLEPTLASIDAEISDNAAGPLLRAVTYNIHSGMGQWWKAAWLSRATVERHLDGIAAAIIGGASAPVDIVALNEVDFSARRSGGIDQARYLAAVLEQRTGVHYEVVYGLTRERHLPGFEGGYGNAALVRHPVVEFARRVAARPRARLARGAPRVYEYRIQHDAHGQPLRDQRGRVQVAFGPRDHAPPDQWRKVQVYWSALRAVEKLPGFTPVF